MEELETEIAVGELCDTIEYDYPAFHLSIDYFWAEVMAGDFVLREHETAKWLKKGNWIRWNGHRRILCWWRDRRM